MGGRGKEAEEAYLGGVQMQRIQQHGHAHPLVHTLGDNLQHVVHGHHGFRPAANQLLLQHHIPPNVYGFTLKSTHVAAHRDRNWLVEKMDKTRVGGSSGWKWWSWTEVICGGCDKSNGCLFASFCAKLYCRDATIDRISIV